MYLSSIPKDPTATTNAGYEIAKVGSNIYVEAPGTEIGFTNQSGYSSTTPIDAFIGTLIPGHPPATASGILGGTGGSGGGGGTSWTCGSSLVDSRDSQSYTTSLIGSQCWLSQNMDIGTMISLPADQGTSLSSIQKYCYNNDPDNCTTYGGLYQYGQASGGSSSPSVQGICPTGWHIPTQDEFTTLELAICTSDTCVTDFPHNTPEHPSGTDEGTKLLSPSGSFKALLAGQVGDYMYGKLFAGIGQLAIFSLSSGFNSRYLLWNSGKIWTMAYDGIYAFPIRCLKD